MADDADRIIDLYERHSQAWDRDRWRNLFERPWLDRFLALVPRGGAFLDLGCGSGEPISRYFIEAGYTLTGIDSSPAMIDLCRSRFLHATWIVTDMRSLALAARFDGILAWDSFFHLRQEDQRAMFPVFRRHAAGNDTVFGGLGNDSILHLTGGSPRLFGNEGNDTIDASGATAATIVGGNDATDGSNSIFAGAGADIVFGNGGADTILADLGGAAADTVVAGFGSDSVDDGFGGNNLYFGNEGDDTLATSFTGQNTVFGGLGNDSIRMTNAGGAGSEDTLQGNEGNDTIRGNTGIDTISGGSGNDVFVYENASNDGDNAAGGGPVEFLTDVNWGEDRIQTPIGVAFATNIGAAPGADLNTAANNAVAAAFAANGSVAVNVAAQFTFNSRTYVAINQDGVFNGFADGGDLMLDITGVAGTIGNGNFIT